MFSILPEELKDKGYSLKTYGVNEYAWSYEEVKKVIIFLADHDYAVPGGDVWKRENGEFISTYDSWYHNRDKSVTWEKYVEQSKNISLTYIETYFQRNGEWYYYVPVTSSKKDV